MRYENVLTTYYIAKTLYRAVEAANFPDSRLIFRNTAWASRLQMDAELATADGWIDRFGRFQPFEDSFSQPLALCYHGHQFGVYNPDLGDGRGFYTLRLLIQLLAIVLILARKGLARHHFPVVLMAG